MTASSKLRPNFNGMTFRELRKLREEFLRDAATLFDKLVSGEKKVSEELWIDDDPFHDRNPRRVLQLTALIEIRQETKP